MVRDCFRSKILQGEGPRGAMTEIFSFSSLEKRDEKRDEPWGSVPVKVLVSLTTFCAFDHMFPSRAPIKSPSRYIQHTAVLDDHDLPFAHFAIAIESEIEVLRNM